MKLFVLSLCLFVAFLSFASLPEDYYATLNGKQAAELKTELHYIIMQDTTRYLAYGSGINHTWNGFYITDRDTTNNLVLDMYSNALRYFPSNYVELKYPGFGKSLHIEHSLPKSWWGGHEWAAYKDLNHLYPSDGSTNTSKSNNPLGVVTGKIKKNNGVSKIGIATYDGYSGNVFEPADEYKGDFARTYFYMATAYEHYKNMWDTSNPKNMMQNNTYPVFKQWAINLLLEWHRQDPVSTKEITRNEKVYSIQGNRNPFIDHPELAEYIWGNNINDTWYIKTPDDIPINDKSDFKLNLCDSSFIITSEIQTPITYTDYTSTGQLEAREQTFTNTVKNFFKKLKGIAHCCKN